MIRRTAVAVGLRHWLPIAMLAVSLPVAAGETPYSPGTGKDPRVREAKFLADDQRYLSAVVRLLGVEAESQTRRMSDTFERSLADSALAFGIPDWADHDYRELLAKSRNPRDIAQAWLRLASFYYDRGDAPRAEQELKALRPRLPDGMLVQWQDLMSRVLLAQGRDSQAIDVLVKPDNAGDQTPYMRYNLAIALLRTGREKEGTTVLDGIGKLTPSDADTLALRDKANLVLGYHYLRHHQGGTAIPIFSRVRFKGPFSNRALLGLGWAELSVQGQRQNRRATPDQRADLSARQNLSTIGALFRPGFLDEILLPKKRLMPFRLASVADSKRAALRRALVPWSELITRDPMDPAVQECLLAIPQALSQLGAHQEARQYYHRAIDAFTKTEHNLDKAMDSIRDNRMLYTIIDRDQGAETGWTWRLIDLPAAPETYYLQSLLATHPYQEALKNYRDLRLMQRDLEATDRRLGNLLTNFAQQPHAAVPVSTLIAHVKRANPTAWQNVTGPGVSLQLDTQLSTGTAEQATPEPASTAQPAKIVPQLTLASPPQKFSGLLEQIQALRQRIGKMRPLLARALVSQNIELQKLALDDLAAQKKIANHYLVRARLALAHIYDSQTDNNGGNP